LPTTAVQSATRRATRRWCKVQIVKPIEKKEKETLKVGVRC